MTALMAAASLADSGKGLLGVGSDEFLVSGIVMVLVGAVGALICNARSRRKNKNRQVPTFATGVFLWIGGMGTLAMLIGVFSLFS